MINIKLHNSRVGHSNENGSMRSALEASIFKGRARRPLINNPGKEWVILTAGGNDDATCKLLFKNRLQALTNDETAALLNENSAIRSWSNDIILHTKKLKMKNNSKSCHAAVRRHTRKAKRNAQ